MDTLLQIERQENIERQYNRKHIDGYIRDELISSPDIEEKIKQGVNLVNDWMSKDYYSSKNARIEQLKQLDIEQLVLDIFVGIAYLLKEELFTSVSAQMASRLKFNDKEDSITTIAELMAVLCMTDAFDIYKPSRKASLIVRSRIQLSNKLVGYILNSEYLPPMVCIPMELENNYSSGYLTHNESLILGSGNHHDGDICLDVLNKLNKVALKLDTEFLSTVEEDPSEITVEKVQDKAIKAGKYLSEAQAKERVRIALENWDSFKKQSYEFYKLIAAYGNEFYLTHCVDKRGRIYSQGYHINTQGAPFKKAMIELANQEIIEGVPTQYQL